MKAQYQKEADDWKEGGDFRAAMHAAGGAIIAGLGGGNALGGALGAGLTSKLGGTLNELSESIQKAHPTGNADIDQALAQIVATGVGTAVGAAVGGSSGAFAGYNVDRFNRQLHPDEVQRIKQLSGSDPVKEARLTAAGCALTKCYAEYPEGSAIYQQLKQIADFGASNALAGERQLLSNQTGMFNYGTSGVFSDENLDAAKRLNNTYQIGTRGLGAGQAALGVLGMAGAITSAPVICATGVGCVANAYIAGISADAFYAGSKQVISGQSEATFVNQALTGLGLSPMAAGLLETALGIGAGVTAGTVANKAAAQATLLNAASRETYSNAPFLPKGVVFAPDLIDSNPVVRSMYNEYLQALNGNAQLATVFTGNAIRSGQSLPKMVQLGINDELIRIVPVGDNAGISSFYMSRVQYDLLVSQGASATSIANSLGLPASSLASGSVRGFQAFSI